MPLNVDDYFKRAEKGILGTGYINQRDQWPRPEKIRNTRSGKGHICPNCGIGFWGKSYGRIKCPNCQYSFIIKES
jgi:hypothetical protein